MENWPVNHIGLQTAIYTPGVLWVIGALVLKARLAGSWQLFLGRALFQEESGGKFT